MTKGNLIATSFVGAIPAGALAFLTIKAFLDHSEKMAGMLQVVNGTAVLFSVLMALSPLAILIFMRGRAKPEVETAGVATGASPAVAAAVADDGSAAEMAAMDDDGEAFAGNSASTDEGDDMSLSGFDESAASTSAGSDDNFEFDDSGFEFEDDDQK